MDTVKIVELLGLVPGGSLSITDIQMVQWGRGLVFECVYQTRIMDGPEDEPVLFRLVFNDCREIRYKVYAHIGLHERGVVTMIADVAELLLGQGNHRRDANILTNHFGVTISYGDIHIEKDDLFYDL